MIEENDLSGLKLLLSDCVSNKEVLDDVTDLVLEQVSGYLKGTFVANEVEYSFQFRWFDSCMVLLGQIDGSRFEVEHGWNLFLDRSSDCTDRGFKSSPRRLSMDEWNLISKLSG